MSTATPAPPFDASEPLRDVKEKDRCCCGEVYGIRHRCSCSHLWCALGAACVAHCQCERCAAVSPGVARVEPSYKRIPRSWKYGLPRDVYDYITGRSEKRPG